MHSAVALLVVAAVTGVRAYPQDGVVGGLVGTVGGLVGGLTNAGNNDDPRFTQFTPPGPNDVRSPCPGLNALANHNFIHHDGRNMTLAHLLTGLREGMSMSDDFTLAIGGAGILSNPNPALGYFDLNMLDEHNFPIEHDSSLSRQDAYLGKGNDYSFNTRNYNQWMAVFGDANTTTIKSLADAKYARYNDSLHRNPQFTYGIREFIFSWGETAIYAQAMSDPFSGVVRLDYIRQLFEEERLPYNLGWRRSQQEVSLLTLGQMVTEMVAVSPEPAPEFLNLTVNSYKDLFEVINETGGLIGNFTGTLGE